MKKTKTVVLENNELPDKFKWVGSEWDGWAKGHTFSFLMHSITLNDIFVPAGYYFSNYGVISPKYALEHPKSWAPVVDVND